MKLPTIPLVALPVIALDQASKLAVVFGLNLINRAEIEVMPPFLNFRMAWNYGVNFGLLADYSALMRLALIAVALVISVWVYVWIGREKSGRPAQISAGLLIGGAMGNVIDRVAYGAVADFLNMSCCGIDNPFAFNVADIAIFFGAIGLVMFSNFASGKTPGQGKSGRKTP